MAFFMFSLGKRQTGEVPDRAERLAETALRVEGMRQLFPVPRAQALTSGEAVGVLRSPSPEETAAECGALRAQKGLS
jgi:hypothetical protein